jgi:ABC-type transport system involved in multi-copper enzyme maturation permease subunit
VSAVITRPRPGPETGPPRFGRVLHAEWTKFRTVRGWIIGMFLGMLLIVVIPLLDHSSCGGQASPGSPPVVGLGCSSPAGPGGEGVIDSFYFVHQPLGRHGAITARMTSLTSPGGLTPWTKAGVIIQASLRPGSAYAAMMVTAGHGVRMQYDYTGDIAGPAARVTGTAPRWLRLTRAGDTLTGYQSADGTHWRAVGTVRLAGLPATAAAGLFATSPVSAHSTSRSIGSSSGSGSATLGTARFDHVTLRAGTGTGTPSGAGWAGTNVGAGPGSGAPPGSGFHQAGGTVTVTGSGDIAPDVAAGPEGTGTPMGRTLLGVFFGLIAVAVVAAMFTTAEYRRGLIRATFAASPRRGRVLAAKAAVIAAVSFGAALPAAVVAVAAGEWVLRSNGNYILPASPLTEMRVVAGSAALVAVTAVLALSLGTLLRHSAGAITLVMALIVLPYFFSAALPILPPGAAGWLLRVTPAAGFAIQQAMPQYTQVTADYTPGNGYFPLPPWAGFAVLCAWAAVAMALAAVALRRRDA